MDLNFLEQKNLEENVKASLEGWTNRKPSLTFGSQRIVNKPLWRVSKKTDNFCLLSHHLEVQRSGTSKALSELLNVFVKLLVCYREISQRSACWWFLSVSLAFAIWSSECPFLHAKHLLNAFQRHPERKGKQPFPVIRRSQRQPKGSIMTSWGCLVNHYCGWKFVHEACSLHSTSSSIKSSES